MSSSFAGRSPPRGDKSSGSGGGDKVAALLTGPDRPIDYLVDELLRAWRDAQRDATEAYASWHELASDGGYPAYLAALDREERAAEVYAEVRRRRLAWSP
jgi:hypothetical protein